MTQRQCGDCSLCCRLLPVRELDKAANQRCAYQRHRTGCRVYHTAEMPAACSLWNCRWLVYDDTAELSRPDRAHYVIDLMPDFIEVINNVTGLRQSIEVVQVWLDPRHPDAHEDPALRAYLERRALEGKLALIRFNAREAFTLWAPCFCPDGQWHQFPGNSLGRDHTPAEILQGITESEQ